MWIPDAISKPTDIHVFLFVFFVPRISRIPWFKFKSPIAPPGSLLDLT